MKKNLSSIIILALLFTSCILILLYSDIVIESVYFSLSLWKDNIIPSLLPFFILSELLINYGFITLLGNLLRRIMNVFFHLPGEASFIIIASLITGSPSSSKYIKDLLDNNLITLKEGEYLLMFTHFSNPLFVIGIIGTLLLNNKVLGVFIYISHILSNLIIALIFRPKKEYISTKISLSNTLDNITLEQKKSSSFIMVLSNAIYKSINTLLLIFGIITFFVIITNLFKTTLNLDYLTTSIISGLLELTQGIYSITYQNISLLTKIIICTFFISFGGFSIHLQVFSILNSYKIKYKYYFIGRLLQGIISSILIFIIYQFLY